MGWARTILEALRIVVPIAGDGIREAVKRRRQPPAPLADLDETADVIADGRREWDAVRGDD